MSARGSGSAVDALPGIEVRPLGPCPRRLFSVDVEDWYHSNFEGARGVDTARLPRRVEAGVEQVLEALDAAASRATFFVLGEVAEEHPGVVRRIAARGHEVGCHSRTHRLLYEQADADVAADLASARARLQDLSAQPVWGFRAPSWSVTARNLRALDQIAAAGFRYDSSIFPAANYLYGIDGAPVAPYRLRTPRGSDLLELPPSTVRIGPRRLGVGGGFYLRVLPLPVHRLARDAALRRGEPFMAYVHPRELDPGSWRFELPLGAKERFIHRGAMGLGAARARAMVAWGGWEPLGALLEAA